MFKKIIILFFKLSLFIYDQHGIDESGLDLLD